MMPSDETDQPPADGSKTQDQARDRRRAQALRANLKRRKAQLRGRAAAVSDLPGEDDPIKTP